MNKQCVKCGADTTAEKVFCAEVKDYHCTHKECGYKELRVIEHPVFNPDDIETLIAASLNAHARLAVYVDMDDSAGAGVGRAVYDRLTAALAKTKAATS